MIHTQISSRFRADVDLKSIHRIAQYVVDQIPDQHKLDLTIVISDDKQLRQLNNEFMNIDSPTDVLSFPVNELDPESGHIYKGDIVISYERAEEQALTSGHSTTDEIELLVVHGTLHLLGYDHSTPEDKQSMWSLQSNILHKFGNPLWDKI